MPEHALAFVAFSVVVAGTPGPSNTLLTAVGATVGVLRGLPAVLGVASGMAALMFAVTFGLGSVILTTPFLLSAIKLAGAAILVWLAWKIATSSSAHGSTSGSAAAAPPSVGFVGAAAFQVVNPK